MKSSCSQYEHYRVHGANVKETLKFKAVKKIQAVTIICRINKQFVMFRLSGGATR